MMKEIKAKEVMKMFENQNVVNRTDFTFEEYLDQLISFPLGSESCEQIKRSKQGISHYYGGQKRREKD